MSDHPDTSHDPPPSSARSSAELVAAARARVRELSVEAMQAWLASELPTEPVGP